MISTNSLRLSGSCDALHYRELDNKCKGKVTRKPHIYALSRTFSKLRLWQALVDAPAFVRCSIRLTATAIVDG
jgi:hypothetical protein